VRTVKAPGFGPKGVLRCVLPFTVFLKLKDIGGNVLPPYDEEFREVAMDTAQAAAYRDLAGRLTQELKQALAKRDTTLLGVVLNVLLAWPDCCFRSETVVHPRTRNTLAFVPAQFNELEVMPKERELIDICKQEKAEGRKVLVYSVYTGTRDTTSRLKVLLEQEGFKVAVLRASVDASRREDWIAEQLDRGIDVLITNPELVKTGLDLLEFPTIVFLQSGYNVYSLQQAARRSWRIGQKQPVRVIYLGYANSSQMTCLGLMAKKIMVSQSTSGDVPESGLDVLNQDGDSVEVALARQLVRTRAARRASGPRVNCHWPSRLRRPHSHRPLRTLHAGRTGSGTGAARTDAAGGRGRDSAKPRHQRGRRPAPRPAAFGVSIVRYRRFRGAVCTAAACRASAPWPVDAARRAADARRPCVGCVDR
jgi:hypothetical protein